MAQLPLEGIRVLAQGIVWAGPYCTMQLADLGAEVIEIEYIQKLSMARNMSMVRFPPPVVAQTAVGATYPNRELGERHWERSSTFNFAKRNHRSVTIDWGRPRGMELFLKLVSTSDVFLENNTVATMEKLGITYERLKGANPRIIYLSFPGYGKTGPYRNYKSFGANLEAMIGHTWIRTYRDMAPSEVSTMSYTDPIAGLVAAFAVMSALHYREQTGKGQFIEMAQVEAALHHFSHAYMDYSLNRRNQDGWGNRAPSMAPHNAYPCVGDDYWVAIAVENDEQFQTLCRVMGRPELAEDPRFADLASRYNNQDELDPIISQWTRDKGHYEVMHLLQREGVPAMAVLKQTDMVNKKGEVGDPHLKARGYFERVTYPFTGPIVDGKETPGTHLYPGPLAKLSKTPLSIKTPAPTLGQHNEYVYKELLGLSDAEYQQLEEEQIIGDTYLDTAT